MGLEKYSKQAFLNSEAKQKELHNEGKRLQNMGQLNQINNEALRAQYMVEGEKQKDMVGLAHEEALQEKKMREHPPANQFSRIEFTTESGNKYLIQRSEDGKRYTVVNTKEGSITEVPASAMNMPLRKGVPFIVPGYFSTTNVAEGRAK